MNDSEDKPDSIIVDNSEFEFQKTNGNSNANGTEQYCQSTRSL